MSPAQGGTFRSRHKVDGEEEGREGGREEERGESSYVYVSLCFWSWPVCTTYPLLPSFPPSLPPSPPSFIHTHALSLPSSLPPSLPPSPP